MKLATKKEGKDIFRNIQKRKERKRMPFSVMYELTYRCNFKCPHCYLGHQGHDKKKELDTSGVKRVLDGLLDAGVYSVAFTGGEPLIREDIFEILSYANRSGFRFGLLTNGYLIDSRTADRLKKVNVDKVDITFNSMDPQTFTKLTGVKGSYEKVSGAIELLKRRDMQVAIKSSATPFNKDELEKISKFARKMDIPYRVDGEIMPCLDGRLEWVEKFSLDAKTFYDIRKKVHPELFRNNGGKRQRRKTGKKRDRLFNCGVGRDTFSIDPCGRMNFCLEIGYPGFDILKLGAEECWEKLKKNLDEINKQALKEGFPCRDCDLFSHCGWCPGRSYLETRSFKNCSEYFRERAIAKKRW